MRMIDVHVYSIDLVSINFRSAFAHDKQAPLLASWWRAISYSLRSHLVFLQGKVNSAGYITQVGNPFYCHLFDRKVMCFFSRTTHDHIRQLRRNVLFVVYNNCPGYQYPLISPI